MDVEVRPVARFARQLKSSSEVSIGERRTMDRRGAVHALLVAVGHRADTGESVDAILETGGQRHALRLALLRAMNGMPDGMLAGLVRAFRRLFALDESRLTWASLYDILVAYVLGADIRGYLAVGSHRLKGAVESVAQTTPVRSETRRPHHRVPGRAFCLQ